MIIRQHPTARKGDGGSTAVCTLRSLPATGHEVGRTDVRIEEAGDHVEARATLRAVQRSTAVEPVGCRQASAG